MNAGTGLGIAGLVVALVGAFTPIVGLYIGWVALLIVSVAALLGERGLTIATVVLSVFAFTFLTPSLWVGAGVRAAASSAGGPVPMAILLPVSSALIVAPIACIIFTRRRG